MYRLYINKSGKKLNLYFLPYKTEERPNEGSKFQKKSFSLKKWFSNAGTNQKLLEDLLTNRWVGLAPQVSNSVGGGKVGYSALLMYFQVTFMLPVSGPHLENHCFRVNIHLTKELFTLETRCRLDSLNNQLTNKYWANYYSSAAGYHCGKNPGFYSQLPELKFQFCSSLHVTFNKFLGFLEPQFSYL